VSQERRPGSLLRANVAVAAGTGLSRLTGAGRAVALAWALGQTRFTDAYTLANNTPNIIFELLVGGVLSATLVPVFVRALDGGDDDAVSAVTSVVAAALVALTAAATLAVPLLIRLYTLLAKGDDVGLYRSQATHLAFFFVPQILFYGLTALGTALLNARRSFTAPAFAPVLNNVVVIATLLVLPSLVHGDLSLEAARDHPVLVLVLGLGTTGGIVAMTAALLPALRSARLHLRWHPDRHHPAVRRVVRMSGWTAGYVAANQVALLVVTTLAAGRAAGDVSAYVMAFVFFQLPHGLLAVSLMTTFQPSLSSHAGRGDLRAFRRTFGYGLRLLVFAVAPAAAGYVVLAHPVVSLLLERGAFSSAEAARTASVLVGLAVGLVGYSVYLYVLRGFYALQDTRTPFLVCALQNAINIVVAIAVVGDSGVEGLAWAYSLSYVLAALVALRLLTLRVGQLGADTAVGVVRALVAAVVTAFVVLLARRRVDGDVVQVVVCVPVGVAAYLATTAALALVAPGRRPARRVPGSRFTP
jgi:putative peptidoglycan lipid II flippase